MPTIHVQTVSGLPAFQMPCAPTDTVKKLQVAAARKACVVQKTWDGSKMRLKEVKEIDNVRLSMGREFLNPADTVMALGLKDGAKMTLHIKAQPLVGNKALPARSVYSFAREGYGFFITVVLGVTNRELFKLKVVPNDKAASVLKQALKRAKLAGWAPAEGKTPRLKLQGKPLPPTAKVMDVDLKTGETVELWGLAGDEYPEMVRDAGASSSSSSFGSRPGSAPAGQSIVRSMGGSFNLLAHSRSGAVSPGRTPIWMPIGRTNWP